MTLDDKPEGEGAIPYGLDPVTLEQYTIDDADPEKGIYYLCPKCRNLLVQRRGTIYRDYFAHHQNPFTSNDCPWYLGGSISVEPVPKEYMDLSNRLRLFIVNEQNTQNLTLYGSIPSFSAIDIPIMQNEISLGHEIISSQGTVRPLNPRRDLLPDSPTCGIALDPNSEKFDIKIVNGFTNSGIWKTDKLSAGDIFIGDSISAERITLPHYVTTGQFIYVIAKFNDLCSNTSVTSFQLGKYSVVRVMVDKSNDQIIQELAGDVKIDSFPIHVDVIFPLDEEPKRNWLDQTGFKVGEEITIALTPSKKTDPILEIIPIPFKHQIVQKLQKAGPGNSRFIKIISQEATPFRLLIYWPGVPEREVLIDFVPEKSDDKPLKYTEPEILLALQQDGQIVKLNPLDNPKIKINGSLSPEGVAIIPSVQLISPRHYKVEFEAEFPSERGSIIRREGDANATEIQQKISEIFERFARMVRVIFRNLGTITLNCDFFYTKQIGQWQIRKRGESATRELERIESEKHQKRDHLKEMSVLVIQALEKTPVPRRLKVGKEYTIEKLRLPTDTSKKDLIVFRNLIRRYRKGKRRKMRRQLKLNESVGETR